MSLYDIRITRITDTDELANTSVLYVQELHQCSPALDPHRFYTDNLADPRDTLIDSCADNGWDLNVSYPYGFEAEWIEVTP